MRKARTSASVERGRAALSAAAGAPKDVRRTTDADEPAGVAECERELALEFKLALALAWPFPCACACPFARCAPGRRVLSGRVRECERSALCGVTVREVAVLAMLDEEAECGGV